MLLHHLDVLLGVAAVLAGLSLVVTLVVQAVVAVLALRGTDLRWGLETLLANVSSLTPAQVSDVVAHVLRHPLVSGSVLATRPGNGRLLARMLSTVKLDRLQRRWALAKAIRAEELLPVMRLLAEAKETEPWREALRDVLKTESDALVKVRSWFDRTMDRVSERFTTRTRWIAIIASFALACTLHVDVLHLYGAVSTDPALRTSLVALAGELGERDLAREEQQLVQTALRTTAASHQLGEIDPAITTVADAEAWLDAKAMAEGSRREAMAALNRRVAEARLTRLREQVSGLSSGAVWDALDFWAIRPDHAWSDWYTGERPLRHALGVLFGGALLSLGAPFWFNLLKNLMGLRPVLAEKADRERAGRR